MSRQVASPPLPMSAEPFGCVSVPPTVLDVQPLGRFVYLTSVPSIKRPVDVGTPVPVANLYSRKKKFCDGCEP